MPKIRVRSVSKVFGRREQEAYRLMQEGLGKDDILKKTGAAIGVNDANFDVIEGEFFVVMGLSGSGKSTLIRCLNRLHEPTAGEIIVDGQDLCKLSPRELLQVRREKFGMVFQSFALFPHRTVLGNVAYGLEVQGVARDEREGRARQVIEMVGLGGWEDRRSSELSGGMQQRVGLARALAVDPDILLMDEAFSALDPLIRKEMQDELLELQSRMSKTIVFITHDLDEALRLGDRIAIMRDGVIIQIGTPEEIVTHPADAYVAAFTEGVDRSKVLTAGAIMQRAYTVTPKDGPSTALRQMQRYGVSSLLAVDRSRRLIGILTAERAAQARQEQSTLDTYIDPNVTTVREDEALENLILTGATSNGPLVVVNDERVVRGVIVRGALLAALATGPSKNRTKHGPATKEAIGDAV